MIIPKFRLTSRLIKWMDENYYQNTRFPSRNEEVFFKSKEDSGTIANNLVHYASKVYMDKLDGDLEDVIKKSPSAVVAYIAHLKSRSRNMNSGLLLSLAGHGQFIAQVSTSLGRLSKEFEDDIQHPEHFVQYMNGIRMHDGKVNRIPEMEARIFDPNKFPAGKVAECVVRYATIIGTELPEELKNLLMGHGNQIIEYATVLNNWNKTLDDGLLDSMAGDDKNLLRYAQNHIRRRLPNHLEKTMTDPHVLLNYAKSIVRGRLPEEMENNFAADHVVASTYAFDVIRGFACVRLPDVVHTAMIMKSAANPNDHYIKRYVKECEKDTTVSGSW